jgi:tRNA uridine 5-carboxymethylaminomethyl modification enzyme
MFTSRAEFRLHLRIDNADRRLTPHGRRLGLVNDEAWAEFEQKQARMKALERLLSTGKVQSEGLRAAGLGNQPATAGLTWAQLLKRPEVTIEPLLAALRGELARGPLLAEFAPTLCHPEVAAATEGSAVPSIKSVANEEPGVKSVANEEPGVLKGHDFSRANKAAKSDGALAPEGRVSWGTDPSILRAARRNEARAVETEIKFAGYLEQQKKSIERLKAAESVSIPDWLEYGVISGLSREMHEKLERIRPQTLGQASRIPGVTPAALSLVHVAIRIQGKLKDARATA